MAIGVVRGCGTRILGAAYLEVPTSPVGRPIEDFLVDPPVRVDTAAMGLSPVGVRLIERPDGSGTTDVYDWIGNTFYENVADFVEETRRYGVSRRIAENAEFDRLTAASRLVLVHSRAWIIDSASYLTERRLPCPTGRADHALDAPWPPMCIGLCWEDIEGGYAMEDAEDPREAFRAFPPAHPQFRYVGRSKPEHVEHPLYGPAIFCVLPIRRIAVVRDPRDGTHQAVAAKAARAAIPVEEVEE